MRYALSVESQNQGAESSRQKAKRRAQSAESQNQEAAGSEQYTVESPEPEFQALSFSSWL